MANYHYCFTSWQFVDIEADSEEEAFELAESEVDGLYDEVELISVDDEDC